MNSSDPVTDPGVVAAAQRLLEAGRSGQPCEPIRDLIGEADVVKGYAVQQLVNGERLAAGATVVGRKIGLTSKAVQAQLGVDQPDFGWLFDDMGYAEDQVVPMSRLIQPKAEAEIAFVLKADLADGPLDAAQCREAVDYAVAALEIVDSRIADWNIKFSDTVSDNASSGLYVLAGEPKTLAEFDPVAVEMTMTINGEQVSAGNGAACLGDPLNAVAWLAQKAREFGEPLRAGQVILSGALGPMANVPAGAVVTAEITGLGNVTATFSH